MLLQHLKESWKIRQNLSGIFRFFYDTAYSRVFIPHKSKLIHMLSKTRLAIVRFSYISGFRVPGIWGSGIWIFTVLGGLGE